MTPQEHEHLAILFASAEQAALDAYALIDPPGGIVPVDDAMRATLAQAKALAAFALIGACQVRVAAAQMAPAEEPPPSEPVP